MTKHWQNGKTLSSFVSFGTEWRLNKITVKTGKRSGGAGELLRLERILFIITYQIARINLYLRTKGSQLSKRCYHKISTVSRGKEKEGCSKMWKGALFCS